MSFRHRIRTIYWKELTDIMRDRRTLIAMILVPIVLYPLLMLGSVQAVSYQQASLDDEHFVVGVVGENQASVLRYLLQRDAAIAALNMNAPDSESESSEEKSKTLADLVKRIVPFESRETLEQLIRERRIHAGVVFKGENFVDQIDKQNEFEILADYEEVRSRFVANGLQAMFQQVGEYMKNDRKRRAGLPKHFDKPFSVSSADLSSPPSILGQILPLILVLMTITGAIYPAIDLTAGERERGTLESLMVSPVPVIDLIVGKFLVVTTVAIMGAALNLGSVTATVYFGGFDKIIASTGGSLPLGTMALILVCLVPFAVLMSAIMIAVCSYARTFKEAQNYVTPVIMAVLIPGGIAALPATRMEGIMLVMPVGNMVLLARDLLLGAVVPTWNVVLVVVSTTLYASSAVAVAASVFGRESVVFSDAGSIKTIFSRSLIKPSPSPSVSMSLLIVALLFPVWYFIQSAISPSSTEESASGVLYATGVLMPMMFVVVPVVVLLYWKVEVRRAFSIRMPGIRHLVGGILIGISIWIPAHELNLLQFGLLGAPPGITEYAQGFADTLRNMPLFHVVLLIAVVPAVCEELLFRGLLLGGLGCASRKWPAILVSAAVFGVFHFLLFKFAVTAALGVVLAYACWQSKSIVPGMVAHMMHNALTSISVIRTDWVSWVGLNSGAESESAGHLPIHLLAIGAVLLCIGLFLLSKKSTQEIARPTTITPDFP